MGEVATCWVVHPSLDPDKNISKGYLASDSMSTSWFAPDMCKFNDAAAFSDNSDAFTV